MDEHGTTILGAASTGNAGLGVRDIMGYCITALLFSGSFSSLV